MRKREVASSGLMLANSQFQHHTSLVQSPTHHFPRPGTKSRPNRCPGERPYCSRCHGRWPDHKRRQSLYRRSQNPVLVRRTNHLRSESRTAERQWTALSSTHGRTDLGGKIPRRISHRACPLERGLKLVRWSGGSALTSRRNSANPAGVRSGLAAVTPRHSLPGIPRRGPPSTVQGR